MCGFAFEYEEPIYEESKMCKIKYPQKQEEEKKFFIKRNKEKKESDFNLQDLI